MLSVIVHGRNDHHGYNLHKRVAISLNCVAQLLGADDEILFVDWNTPDELPSLPEAIADTLTERCRQILRILRVRPQLHRRVCRLSHLPVLDAVARNTALRRSNPRNQWVLSTTTDIILAPRRPGRQLADIIGSLAPALYHLPRFELPESLWESLDRRDPDRAIELSEIWGSTLYLKEIVEADALVRYDGPGDFQLLPMAVAKELCGFDERMVFTYHMDSNLAKRASMILGPVETLVGELFLYHCHHYRQSSVHHGPMRAENWRRRFVDEVDQPVVPGQEQNWGLADEVVEEIVLAPPGEPPLAAALRGAAGEVPGGVAGAPWSVKVGADTFNNLDYQPAHVLAFVADLLTSLPRDVEIGVFAADTTLVRQLALAWRELNFSRPILVTDTRLVDPNLPILAASEDQISERATAILFEFGADPPRDAFASRLSLGRLSAVADAFRRAVALERQRVAAGNPPRQRFIVVNAINTVFERLVADHLAFTYTPFTGRVRHGVVVSAPDPLATDIASLSAWLAHRTGRPTPRQEVVDAVELITAALGTECPPPASAPVLALLDHPRLCEAFATDRGRLQHIAEQARRLRPAARLAPLLQVPVAESAEAGPPALCKFAAIEDWEDEQWAAQLRRCGEAAETANLFRRHRSTWELAHLLYAAGCAAPAPEFPTARVILGSRHALPAHLCSIYSSVEIAVAGGSRAMLPAEVWPCPGLAYPPSRVRMPDDGAAFPGGGRSVGLIILPDNAILAAAAAGLIRTLQWLDSQLTLGGILVFAAEVTIAGKDAPDRLPGRLVAGGVLERLIARHTGLEPLGGADWRISETTLDRLAVAGTSSEREPHFVLEIDGMFSTTAVWVFRKSVSTATERWVDLADELAAHAATVAGE